MAQKLERIYEFRSLLSKAQELQIPLTAQEQVRLERLRQQLPAGVPSCDDRDPYTLLAAPLPAQYVCGGRFGTGALRNASGGGMAIATADPPALGQRLIVHVREAHHGLEFTFPGRVVARVVKGLVWVGVSFEGVPSQTRFAGRGSGVWRPDEASTANAGPRRNRNSA